MLNKLMETFEGFVDYVKYGKVSEQFVCVHAESEMAKAVADSMGAELVVAETVQFDTDEAITLKQGKIVVATVYDGHYFVKAQVTSHVINYT